MPLNPNHPYSDYVLSVSAVAAGAPAVAVPIAGNLVSAYVSGTATVAMSTTQGSSATLATGTATTAAETDFAVVGTGAVQLANGDVITSTFTAAGSVVYVIRPVT